MSTNMKLLLSVGVASLTLLASVATKAEVATDFVSIPPTLADSADPNVLIDLSVETPMQGAAYNDQPDAVTGCTGREDSTPGGSNDQLVGVCYDPATEYIGYFDSNKCYDYNSTGGYFEPDNPVGPDHTCSGEYSGNFMNWASMSAIDIFRMALTGGHRVIDTATQTVLASTELDTSRSFGHSWYPLKKIDVNHPDFPVDPSTVTPYNENVLWVVSHDTRIDFERTKNARDLDADLNVHVEVCDVSEGLEANCNAYGTNYKPEGLMQDNAHRMRFAVMSYLSNPTAGGASGDHGRHGGVLRSKMKYIGELRAASGGGLEANPNNEWDPVTGVFVTNPDPSEASASGVTNSGVMNYINKFGGNGYKIYDPVGELFYECLNYYKNRGPTSDFTAGLTADEKDNFPVITNWDDPIVFQCQKNFIIGINDANPWEDKKLPGTAVTSQFEPGLSPPIVGWRSSSNDWGNPNNADPDINVTTLTNTVGDLQGITGTMRNVGCVPGDCDMISAFPKMVNELGRTFGTAPWAPKENSYYVAGLSYYANSTDLRTGPGMEGRQTVRTFMVDTQEYSANPLVGEMNMLWLTGKYGGFKEIDFVDTNGDGNPYEPNLASEWDANGDGDPDNYVLASRPERLVSGLQEAFLTIETRVSAGSAAAVVANSGSGIGQLVQALYQPTVKNESEGQQISWTGILHSFFIDSRGFLREDTNQNNQMDDYNTDYVLTIQFDEQLERTRAERKIFDKDTLTFTHVDFVELTHSAARDIEATGTPRPGVVKSVWNARDELAKLDNASIGIQRNYTSQIDATNTRYIFTGLDTDLDGFVTSAETFSFTAGNIDSTNFRFFDIAAAVDETLAQDVVNWVRGQEGITGFRSRLIDIDDGNNAELPTPNDNEIWRLGDIVHSTPVVVGVPQEGFGLSQGDDTYAAFVSQYENRRQMVYVGSNGGMVHAFNGGFWDPTILGYKTQLTGEVPHPLGSEVWAYVPGNLVPHLQWLTDPAYNHIYYVDGPPIVFDANIFPNDAVHPNGWGTVLVVSLRFGGSPINIDTDGNSVDDYTTQSAYVIFDITDPESPPELIAEITHPQLGLTSSRPAVVYNRVPGVSNNWAAPTTNEWYLVFGSGPTVIADATSTQNARMFMFDLNTKSFVTGFGAPTNGHDTGFTNSFVGDIGAADWNNDFVHDAAYFGTVGGTVNSPTGSLQRIRLSDNFRQVLIDPSQPFVSRPNFARSTTGDRWVHAGTGRLFVKSDSESTPQQSFYGIKEPKDSNGDQTYGTVTRADLQDVTNVQVFQGGVLGDPDGVLLPDVDASGGDSFDVLQQHIADSHDGWYFDFTANGVTGSTRNLNAAIQVQNLLIFTDYVPSSDICLPEGNSGLHVLDFSTGVASAHGESGALGTDSSTTVTVTDQVTGQASTAELLVDRADLGRGLASEPVVHHGSDRPDVVTILDHDSTGGVDQTEVTLPPAPGGRASWRELELQ